MRGRIKLYYVYILQCADETLYTGICTELDRRVEEHNSSAKGAKYTRARRPVKLVYFETYIDRSSASTFSAIFLLSQPLLSSLFINSIGFNLITNITSNTSLNTFL